MKNEISTTLGICIAHFHPKDSSPPLLTEMQSCFSRISLQNIDTTVPVGNFVTLSPHQKLPARPGTAAPSFAAFEPFALVFVVAAAAADVEPALARADAASSQPFSTR